MASPVRMLRSRARRRTQRVPAVAGLLANPVTDCRFTRFKTTGCGLLLGPGVWYGAAKAVSDLAVAGIVGWALFTKMPTGSCLPAGPHGLLRAVEGVPHLTTVLAIFVVCPLWATSALVEAASFHPSSFLSTLLIGFFASFLDLFLSLYLIKGSVK